MLRAPDGATIEEIMAATGWQSHTARGAMAGALKKKLGLEVTSEKIEGRGRVYFIGQGPEVDRNSAKETGGRSTNYSNGRSSSDTVGGVLSRRV